MVHISHERIAELRSGHVVLAETFFEPVKLSKGYAGRTLHVDLTRKKIEIREVTEQMKELWIGGKGFDLWLMFQEINENTKWNSPENPICFSSGPLGGVTSFPGSGKMLVTSISPQTHNVIDCNVGGYFGPYLKFTGFDALCVVGKALQPVVLVIDGEKNVIRLETAPYESLDTHILAEELTEMFAVNELDKRNVAVVCSGSASRFVSMCVLNFSFYDWRRRTTRIKQAGRGGIGRVMTDKNLKAIVAKKEQINPAWSVTKSSQAAFFENSIKDDCDCKAHEQASKIREIIAKYNAKAERVTDMLLEIQKELGYLPERAIDEITAETRVPKGELYHMATFYGVFTLAPKGKNVIRVCTGAACAAKGATRILEAFERELSIKAGATTNDGAFTLEGVPCLGICGMAPVVTVGEEVFGEVEVTKVSEIVKKFGQGGQAK